MSVFRTQRRNDGQDLAGGTTGRVSPLERRRRRTVNWLERLEVRTLLSFTQIATPTPAYVAATTNLSPAIPANGVTTTAISGGGETVAFSSTMTAGTVPGSGPSANWNTPPTVQSATPRTLFVTGTSSLTIALSSPASIFGFEEQPASAPVSISAVTATFLENGVAVGSFTQSTVNGGGALQFAASTNQAFTIVVVTQSAAVGFDLAQISFAPASAVLGLTKTVVNPVNPGIVNPPSTVQVNPGGNLVYTLTATNSGPNDAINASVTDTLPTGTSVLATVSPAGWNPSVSANTVTFTNPDFANGASATFNISVAVSSTISTPNTLSDTGSISSSDSTTVTSNAAVAQVVGPNLTFTGNNFRIRRDGTNPAFIDVTVDGTTTSQLAGTIQNITLNGLPPGNGQVGDNLTIDDSNGLVTNNPPSTPVATPLTISYLGNSLGVNQLIFQQPGGPSLPANSQETVDVGANSGAGADLITSDGSTANTQIVFFANLNSLFTSTPTAGFNVVPSPTGIPTTTIPPSFNAVLQTSLLNGSNAINYSEGSAPGGAALNANWGRVTADNFASINFRNKDNLSLATGAGDDTTNLNNTAASATTPAGFTAGALKTIAVNSGDPTASDKLIVNGTAGADLIGYMPSSTIGSGLVTITAPGPVTLPPVSFVNTEQLVINGGGAPSGMGDTLTVTGTPSNDRFVVSPGSNVDSGTVQVNTTTPLSYENLGSAPSATYGVQGAGEVVLVGNGGTDLLDYVGHDNSDIYTVAPTTGAITSVGNPGQFTPVVPTAIANLVISAAGGSNVFNIAAPLPYATTSILGGTPAASSAAVANVVGNGSPMSVTLSNSSATIVGGGVGTLTFTGTETVNVNNGGGNVSVAGTAGQPDNLSVTPNGPNSAAVQDNGLSPLVNVTTTGGTLTVAGDPGDQDKVTVHGTSGAQTIGVALGSPTVVTVGGFLPVNVATPTGNDLTLVIAAGLGFDQIDVSGSGGPDTLQVNGNAPSFADLLTVTTTTVGESAVTPGNSADSGIVFTPDSTTIFQGIGAVLVTATSPASTLTVFGTDGNDTITASADPANGFATTVWVNNRAPVVFSGFGGLTLNSGHGNDTIIVTPTDLAPAAVTVQGGDPNATDTLVVNGTGTGDFIDYAPISIDSGFVSVDFAPTLNFSAISGVTINAHGGGAGLFVEGTPGNDQFTVAPGSAVDAGTVHVNTFVPLTYLNLGSAPGAGGGVVGQGEVVLEGNGGTDVITYVGHDNSDNYTVDATGAITSIGNPGTFTPVLPGFAIGQTYDLVLAGAGGSNTFTLDSGLPYASTLILGGTPAASSASVATLNGDGSDISVQLGGSQAIVTGGGLGTVTIQGTETVNVNDGDGNVTVTGTPGTPASILVTPTSPNSASVQDSGLSPVVNVTTTGNTSGSLTVASTPNDVDTVQVVGTGGPDSIDVALGTPTTVVTVVAGSTGYLPVNVSTPLGNNLALIVGSSTGQDKINVSGTGGPATLLTISGSPAGIDTLTVVTSVTGTTTVTASSTPGAGVITTPSGSFQFAGISDISVTSTAAPPNTLVVQGTNGNDAITAQDVGGVDTVTINKQPVVTFAGFDTLTLDGQGGNDTFDVAPAGMAVTTINVNGSQSLGSTLTVDGTAGADAVDYAPTSGGAGTVAIATAPAVVFTGIGAAQYNGNGGNDTVTVTTPLSSVGTAITFTPGATANQGSIALRVGSNGTGGTLLTPLSYTNIDKDGALVFDTANPGLSDSLLFNGVAAGEQFTIGGNATGDGIVLSSSSGFLEALAVTAPGVATLTTQGVGSGDLFSVETPIAFGSETVIGGGPGASAQVIGDGSSTLTVSPAYEGFLANLVGDGIFGAGVFLSNIATANVLAGGADVLFSGTSTGLETDYTPIGPDEGLVTFPGAQTLYDVVDLTAPLAFDQIGTGNLFKVFATANSTAFRVSQSGTDTLVATTETASSTDLLSASIVSSDTQSLVVQGGKGNDVLTVDSTAGPVLIPITFDGGGGQNTLDLVGGTATTDTYTPGPAPGAGTSVLTFGTGPGALTETVNFVGLVPVFDTVAGPLVVLGTNGNDAVAYDAPTNPANQGLVSINNLETIEFGNKTALTINTLNGTDAVNINNTTAQTGLASITVNGGSPSTGDTLTVTGTTGADAVNFTPTGLESGTFVFTTPVVPPISFTNIEQAVYDGQGGGDTLTVTGTQSNDRFVVTPGSFVDSGTVQVNSMVPLGYENLGTAQSPSLIGTGEVVLVGNGGTDTLQYVGHDNSDVYTVAPTTGIVTSVGTPGQFSPVVPMGIANLILSGAGGANTFNISAPVPYSSVVVNGGTPASSSNATANLTGNGMPVTVTLGGSQAIVTGGGLGALTFTGTENVNVNNGAGPVTVTGTAGATDNLLVTPTGADTATVQDNGHSPLLTVTTTASNTSGVLTVAGNPGDTDTIQVAGTGGADTIDVVLGTPTTTVTVVATPGGYLPVNVATPAGNNLTLVVGSSTGQDKINVSGSGGPATLLTIGGSPAGLDTLTVSTADAGTTTVQASSTPGAGQITTPSGSFQFAGISFINVTSTAGPGSTLQVLGSNGNDAITAQHLNGADTVAINSQPVVTFAGYSTLSINGEGGTDTFAISPVGMAVTSIVVNGNDPNDQGTLIVNGTTSQDTVSYTPTGLAAGTVTVDTAAPVTFSNMAALSYNGHGGGDTLTVNGTSSSDAIGITLGSQVDSGTIYVNSTLPLSYSGLGSGSSPMYGAIGLGQVLINGNGGTDSITLAGYAGDTGDIFNVAANGALTSFDFAGLTTPIIPSNTSGNPLLLYMMPSAGSSGNVYNLNAGLPYAQTFIIGGSPAASSASITNLNGDGTPVTVTLSNSSAVVTGGGLNTVTITGNEVVNVNDGAGTVLVQGVAGATNHLVATPTGPNSASVQNDGSSPLVNVNTTATPNTSVLTVAGVQGNMDGVTVLGTSSNDTIGVALGTPTTTVTVNGFLPVNVATPTGNDLHLTVNSLTGKDTINVTGSGGPASLLIQGGSPVGLDTLNVTTAATGTSVVTASSTPGSGTVKTILTGTFGFAGIGFVNITNTAAGTNTLQVNGSNGNDAITAQHLNGADTVAINSQPVVTFAGYATLNINGGGGNDTFDISPEGMAVQSISVNGFNPNAKSQLTVNATSAADAITFTPTGTGAGSVAITPSLGTALPLVTFANIAGVTINGQGAPIGTGDTLTVVGTTSDDRFNVTPGSTVDSGTVQVDSFVPLTYLGLGSGPSAQFGTTGTGTLVLNGNGGTDTLNYVGHDNSDTYNVAATTGIVTSVGSPGQFIPVVPMGVANLVLVGAGGANTFNIAAPQSYTTTRVVGGTPAASSAGVVNLTGSGSPVTVGMGGTSSASFSGGGLGTVTITGAEVVNLNNGAGTVDVFGTAGQPDNIVVTPTGSKTASLQDNGLAPTVNVTTTAANPAPILTVGGNTGDLDQVTIMGTVGNDTINAIGALAPNLPTVTVAPEATPGGLLPVNLITLARVVIDSGDGNDNVVVNSSIGPFTIPVTYNGGSGLDTLTLVGGAATADQYIPGPNPGQGNLALTFSQTGTETVSFGNLAPVLDSVAGPLTVTGTNANNTITYTAGSVITNGLIAEDNFESIEFTNKTILTIQGGGGDDTTIVNNPNTPTGLVAINVDGGLGNNTLVVNAQNQLVKSSDITNNQVNIPGATPVPVGYTNTQQVHVINSMDQLTGVPLAPPVVPPINATAGVPLIDLPVADFYFTDQPPPEFGSPEDFTATINWGDNTPPTAGVINQLSAINNVVQFQVTGSHTYAVQGTFTISVTVTDKGSSRTFTLSSINQQIIPVTITANPGATTIPGPIVSTINVVSNGLIPANGAPISAKEGVPLTNVVIGTFTDTNPGASVANYPPGSVTVNWGDDVTNDTSATVVQVGSAPQGTIFEVLGSHVYLEEGTYQVLTRITRFTIINNVPTPGSTTATAATATVADTPPVVANPQPVVTATEGVQFTEYVARFQEIYVDPHDTSRVNYEPSSDFTATINWGDGTPSTEGAIISAGSPGVYYVLGTHVYPSAGTNGGVGQFTINTTIVEDGGGVLQVTNIANVNDVPITLTGFINQATVVNEGPAGVIVHGNQPTFYGTLTASPQSAAAGGHIVLFAYPVGGGPPILIGQTQAGSDGSWSITSIALPDGTYNVVAFASDAEGQTTTQATILPSGFEGPLVIDTHGPKVLNVSFANRVRGEVNVTFSDAGGLLDLRTVQDAASYLLTKAGTNKRFLVNVIGQQVNAAAGTDTVTLLINDGRQLRGGNYTFTIFAGNGGTGVRDLAGNPLDGVFYGVFPSGNNNFGGSNFVAELNAVHHLIFAPKTTVGFASPNRGPSIPATGTTIPTANPQTPAGNPSFSGSPAGLKSAKVHNRAIHLPAKKALAKATAHDVALEHLASKHHGK
jgi:hypothetical protein